MFVYFKDSMTNMCIDNLFKNHCANMGVCDFTFTFMHWRRKWQPTPVFLPGESQGLGSLVGCRLWGHIESDTTEAT